MIVSCTWTSGSLFLSNGKQDRNMPLKDSTEKKMSCQFMAMSFWCVVSHGKYPYKPIIQASPHFLSYFSSVRRNTKVVQNQMLENSFLLNNVPNKLDIVVPIGHWYTIQTININFFLFYLLFYYLYYYCQIKKLTANTNS